MSEKSAIRGSLFIREAVAADLDAIRECAQLSYAHYIERIGRKPAPMVADFEKAIASHTVDVITPSTSDILGFVISYPSRNHLFLENIAILPTHQKLGLGRRLMDHCETKALALGMTTIQLYTNEKMTENLSWYLQLGYQEINRRREDGFYRVYFEKTLTKPCLANQSMRA